MKVGQVLLFFTRHCFADSLLQVIAKDVFKPCYRMLPWLQVCFELGPSRVVHGFAPRNLFADSGCDDDKPLAYTGDDVIDIIVRTLELMTPRIDLLRTRIRVF